MIFINNDQFKTMQISFYFLEEYNKEILTYRFLLLRLLTSYTNKYPDKQSLSEAFLKLYGAEVHHQLYFYGNFHLMRYTFSFPHPELIEDENYINQLIEVINDIFIDRTLFDELNFNETKRYLIKYIETSKERVFEHAKNEMFSHVYKIPSYRVPIYGTINDAHQISLEDLNKYYQNNFLNNQRLVYVAGKLNDNLINEFKKIKIKSNYDSKTFKFIKHIPNNYQEFESRLSINQSLLFLSYYVGIKRGSSKDYAVRVLSTLLSDYPDNYLFRRFREELGLAYDVDTFYEDDTGFLYIHAAVDKDEVDAIDSLIDIMTDYILDGPTNDELHLAKSFLKKQYLSSSDNKETLIGRQFYNDLMSLTYDEEKVMKMIDDVSINDIRKILLDMKLTTSYTLKGDGDESFE